MQSFLLLKAKSWLLAFTTSLIIVMAVSCQPDSQILNEDTIIQGARITGDYEVREGTLHFRDSESFAKVHKALAQMTQDERRKFAETAGFKSLLAYYDDFSKAIEVAEDEATYKKLLAQYADIVSLDDEQNLVFNVQSLLLASYLDRTGVVYIGQALYRFGDFDQTIVLDGDRAKLNAPESAIVKHISHAPKTQPGARASVCTGFRDRESQVCSTVKSKLSVYAQFQTVQQSNGLYQITITPYAIGIAFKKNAFGSWVMFKTDNRLFAHWTFTAYTTEPNNQPNGPSNPLVSTANDIWVNNWNTIEWWGNVVTFSNLNNGSGGSIFYQFDFPTDNGWHEMPCTLNPMSCP